MLLTWENGQHITKQADVSQDGRCTPWLFMLTVFPDSSIPMASQLLNIFNVNPAVN